MRPSAAIMAALAGLGLLAACTTAAGNPVELTQREVCMNTYKDDPLVRDQCLKSSTRQGSPDDMRPQDLPIRTGQPPQ